MDRSFADQPLSMPIAQHGIVIRRLDGVVHTNVPHLVVHHSPSGYDFGYLGSGPADLALNILEWYLRERGHAEAQTRCWSGPCYRAAWEMHQPFKQAFLTQDQRDIRIPLDVLATWIEAQALSLEAQR